MPIKKLTFSFDVPLTSLLSLLAAGQADLRIDVLGDDKPVPLSKLLGANGVAGLLEGPKRVKGPPKPRAKDANGKSTTSLDLILGAMAKNPDHIQTSSDLKACLVAGGLKPNSVSPQLTEAMKRGWTRKLEFGVYQLTFEGVEECRRRELEVVEAAPKAAMAKAETEPPPPGKSSARVKNGAAHHG